MPEIGNVCLFVPHGMAASDAFVGIPLDGSPGLAKWSSLCNTSTHANGVLELPRGIEFDDFVVWAMLDAANTDAMPAEDVARALKVYSSLQQLHLSKPSMHHTHLQFT